MSSSPAPPPIPQDPGSVSDAVNPSGRREVIVGDQLGMELPDSPANEHDTGTQPGDLIALKGELGALHGCDGLTRRSRSRVVCE